MNNKKIFENVKYSIIFLLIGIVLFVVYDDVNYFFVNKELFVFKWHWIVGITCGVLVFIWSFEKNGKFMNEYKEKPIRRWVLRLLFFLLVSFAIINFIGNVIFYPLHRIIVNKEEMETKVVYVDYKSNSRGLNSRHCIKFTTEKEIGLKNEICRNKELYEKLEISDKLIIIGNKSFFGFQAKEFIFDSKKIIYKRGEGK